MNVTHLLEWIENLKLTEKEKAISNGIFKEIKERLKDRAYFAPKTVSMNLAGGVAAVAAEKYERGETVSYSEMIPSYVRLSQAERDRLEKLKQEKNSLLSAYFMI